MSIRKQLLAVLAVLVVAATLSVWQRAPAQDTSVKEPTRLAVVWTTADRYVAERMLLMYVHASQRSKWFDENLVIVWGPSAKLLSEDKELQAKVNAMQQSGVRFQACIACANMYGVVQQLRDLGIEVKGMGAPLTKLLQDDGWKIMTF